MNRFSCQLVVGMVFFSILSASSRIASLNLIIGLAPTIDVDNDEFEVSEHGALLKPL